MPKNVFARIAVVAFAISVAVAIVGEVTGVHAVARSAEATACLVLAEFVVIYGQREAFLRFSPRRQIVIVAGFIVGVGLVIAGVSLLRTLGG